MKKAVFSLCLCLALTGLPCSSQAEDLALTKPGRVVSTSLLGASFGILIGTVVAAYSSSFTGTPIIIGAGVGFVLGFALAALTPTEEVEEQTADSQLNGGFSTADPPGRTSVRTQAAGHR